MKTLIEKSEEYAEAMSNAGDSTKQMIACIFRDGYNCASEWMPVTPETMPEDCAHVIAYFKHNPILSVKFPVLCFSSNEFWPIASDYPLSNSEWPTHYIQLPNRPE